MAKRRNFLLMEDGYHVADDYRPDMPKRIKAVGYIRVSTKQQAGEDRMGREAQKQEIEKYAEENNYQIVRWYTDEVSGVSEEREALNDILFGDDLDEAGVKAVIAYKSDRIARDIKLYFYYLFLLEKRKIKLVSVMERFDDDEYGLSNVFRSLMLFVAEQERKNILMRTSGGRRVKAEQGGYAGGKPPYGYGVFNKKLVIIEEEAEVVRRIFRYRDSGLSMQYIADILTDDHIKTRAKHNFVSANISKILNNKPLYEGYYRYGNMDKWVKGQHEPILQKRVSMIPDIEIMAKEIDAEEAEANGADNPTSELIEEVEVAVDSPVEQEANTDSEAQNDLVKPTLDIDIDVELEDDEAEVSRNENGAGKMQENLQDAPRPAAFVGGVFNG